MVFIHEGGVMFDYQKLKQKWRTKGTLSREESEFFKKEQDTVLENSPTLIKKLWNFNLTDFYAICSHYQIETVINLLRRYGLNVSLNWRKCGNEYTTFSFAFHGGMCFPIEDVTAFLMELRSLDSKLHFKFGNTGTYLSETLELVDGWELDDGMC